MSGCLYKIFEDESVVKAYLGQVYEQASYTLHHIYRVKLSTENSAMAMLWDILGLPKLLAASHQRFPWLKQFGTHYQKSENSIVNYANCTLFKKRVFHFLNAFVKL